MLGWMFAGRFYFYFDSKCRLDIAQLCFKMSIKCGLSSAIKACKTANYSENEDPMSRHWTDVNDKDDADRLSEMCEQIVELYQALQQWDQVVKYSKLKMRILLAKSKDDATYLNLYKNKIKECQENLQEA